MYRVRAALAGLYQWCRKRGAAGGAALGVGGGPGRVIDGAVDGCVVWLWAEAIVFRTWRWQGAQVRQSARVELKCHGRGGQGQDERRGTGASLRGAWEETPKETRGKQEEMG